MNETRKDLEGGDFEITYPHVKITVNHLGYFYEDGELKKKRSKYAIVNFFEDLKVDLNNMTNAVLNYWL